MNDHPEKPDSPQVGRFLLQQDVGVILRKKTTEMLSASVMRS